MCIRDSVHIIEISQLHAPGLQLQAHLVDAVPEVVGHIDPGKRIGDLVGVDLGIKRQLIDEPVHVVGLMVDGTYIFVQLFRRRGHAVHDPLHIPLDGRDGSLQIMGDVADQLLALLVVMCIRDRG